MRRSLLFLMVSGVFASANFSFAQEAPASFRLTENNELQLHLADERIATFVWNDPELPRPYFKNLRTLAGEQVSRNYPPDPEKDLADHPLFHPGLWLAFGDVSGSDYWRNKARVVCHGGIQLETPNASELGLKTQFLYLAQDHPDQLVCTEDFRCRVIRRPQGYLMLWHSIFSGTKPFYFGDQEEMGLGIRVATNLRAERQAKGSVPAGGGRIRDAVGRIDGAQVWGNSADWCCYESKVGDSQVGAALLCNPQNSRPSWFHARDYGLLEANLFGRAAFHHGEPSRIDVAPGEDFHLRYGVFVYDAPANRQVDLGQAYADYLKLSGN